MGIRKRLFALLRDSPRRDTERVEPTAPQPGLSESAPSTSQRSDGIQSGNNLDQTQSKLVKLSSYVVDPTAAYQNKVVLKSTAHASARLAIDVLKESSDVFTPLKSVAGGLSAVLKCYDQATANRKTIESLIPRVEGLAESLSTPAPENEIKEIERRQALGRKLGEALQELEPLVEQGKIAGFLNNVQNAENLAGLAEDIRDAMMDYQTALQQDIFYKNQQVIDAVGRSLLKGMYHTASAGYLCGDRNGCLKGTRKEVLLQIEQWLTDENDHRVFWLNGFAGTGKSTIAQTFAEIGFADGKLGASFFCSRNFEDRSNLQAIFPTLAFQLAHRYPKFREQLLQVLEASPDVGQETLCSQLEKVIIRPLKATQIPTLIVIDALDECKDKEPASALLSVLSRQVHEIPYVKFFITGRPEPPIQEGFRLELLRPITDVLKLHDVKRSSVDEDIKLYLRIHLTGISKTRRGCNFPEGWPHSYDIDILRKKAAGLFIYASTVVKFVASKHHLPTEQLDLIILRSKDAAHEEGVDLLYTQILQLAFRDLGSAEREVCSRFRTIVGAVLLVFHPLSRKALSELVKACGTPSHIFTTLDSLHSLLDVPDSEDDPIRVFHKSFPDFLTDRTRCKDERFFVDPSVHHELILFSCLGLMKERLKKNICDLDDYAALSEVQDLSVRRETYIGNSLEYACRFWTKHLVNIPGNGPQVKRVQEAIDEFFTKHLLCWIEVLIITGYLGVAVHVINDIRQWYISVGIPTSREVDDSEHLILEYFDLIRDSPSHIYHTALPRSPSSSWLRECYKAELVREVKVLVGLPERWNACSRTITVEGEPSAFAHWGDLLAVGFGSNSVVLLDAITGSRKSVLPGHADMILSLAFSLDGTLLVSGSEDKTVKLWDVQTGGAIKTFSGHPSGIFAVSISPDCTTIASGTHDGAIRLWDIRSGRCHPTVLRHDGRVTAINFSPIDSRRLISSSWDRTVRRWDVGGHQIGDPCHEGTRVAHVDYASDGTRFVSCRETFATVRDLESGAVVAKLDALGVQLDCCCLSPDGRFVACAAVDTIYVWDITDTKARLVRKLVGHSNVIISLAFSSSLISLSLDQSVKFWQSSGFLADSITTDDTPERLGSIPIKSLNLFAKEDTVVTTELFGSLKSWSLSTGACKSSVLLETSWGVMDVHLAGGTLVVLSHNSNQEYEVWDINNGQHLRKVPSSLVELFHSKISADGTKIFGLDHKQIEVRSIQTGEEEGLVRHETEASPGDVLVVHGSKVWLEGSGNVGWDFEGREVSTFSPYEKFPDRFRLDLVESTPPWIQDTVTGKPVFYLPEVDPTVDVVRQWDGRYLVSWSESGQVEILDLDRT